MPSVHPTRGSINENGDLLARPPREPRPAISSFPFFPLNRPRSRECRWVHHKIRSLKAAATTAGNRSGPPGFAAVPALGRTGAIGNAIEAWPRACSAHAISNGIGASSGL